MEEFTDHDQQSLTKICGQAVNSLWVIVFQVLLEMNSELGQRKHSERHAQYSMAKQFNQWGLIPHHYKYKTHLVSK